MKSYSLITDADVMDIGIAKPTTYQLKMSVVQYRIQEITEKCVLGACLRAGERLRIDKSLLILQFALKCFKNSILGSYVKSSEKGKPFVQLCASSICMIHVPSLAQLPFFKNYQFPAEIGNIKWKTTEFGTLDTLFKGFDADSTMIDFFEKVASAKKK